MSHPTAEPTEPDTRTGAALARRSGDLTGLVDRDTFVRAVDQADRDRDRLLVAVITVDGLAEVNQLCGYEAGDRLLSSLARALADWASVDVTVGRVGGSQLGLLLTPLDDRQPARLIDPVVGDLERAVDSWLADRSALGTPSPILPRPRVGVAAGYGAGTWSDAEVAMAVAKGDPDGPAAVHFDLSDQRLAIHRRRQRLAEELVDSLQRHRLPIDLLTAEPIDGGNDPATGTWCRLVSRPALRTRPTHPTAGWRHGLSADDLALAPGLASRLDGHLLATAADVLEGRWPAPNGPSATPERRVALPVLGPLRGLSATLAELATSDGEPSTVLPAGIVLEVEQRQLLDLATADDRADTGPGSPTARATDTPGATLAEQLDGLGWQLAITGFDGGWGSWSLVDRYPVHHLRPEPGLVLAALAGDPVALRLLTMASEAAGDGTIEPPMHLSVPVAAGDGPGATIERLRQIGVTHIERAIP